MVLGNSWCIGNDHGGGGVPLARGVTIKQAWTVKSGKSGPQGQWLNSPEHHQLTVTRQGVQRGQIFYYFEKELHSD